jgi:hypothetical protein
MNNKTVCLGELENLRKEKDANLYLLKPLPGLFSGYKLIRFASRQSLESFNKKAGLPPLVYTYVKKNMAVYKHERETL